MDTNQANGTCCCVFTSTMGLPCQHYLKYLISKNTCLVVSDYHCHWWLHQPVAPDVEADKNNMGTDILSEVFRRHEETDPHQQVQLRDAIKNQISDSTFTVGEPNLVRTEGLPNLYSSGSSTRRDRSLFEHIDISQRSRRKCTNC